MLIFVVFITIVLFQNQWTLSSWSVEKGLRSKSMSPFKIYIDFLSNFNWIPGWWFDTYYKNTRDYGPSKYFKIQF